MRQSPLYPSCLCLPTLIHLRASERERELLSNSSSKFQFVHISIRQQCSLPLNPPLPFLALRLCVFGARFNSFRFRSASSKQLELTSQCRLHVLLCSCSSSCYCQARQVPSSGRFHNFWMFYFCTHLFLYPLTIRARRVLWLCAKCKMYVTGTNCRDS